MSEPWTPACMTAEEWTDWLRLNPLHLSPSYRADHPCRDCPPAFATEQRAAGHCNGMPSQEEKLMDFDDHSDAAEASRLRGRDAHMARIAAERADLAEVGVAAPCGTCAHAPVCAHKLVLDDLGDVTVKGLPELPEEIVLRLTAAMECRWYVRAKGAKTTAGKDPHARTFSPETRERMRQAQLAVVARRKAEKEASLA